MKSYLFLFLSFGTVILSNALQNSKLILYGVDGNPAIEVIAIPPSNGPTLSQQGVIGRLQYLESDITGCSGMVTTMNTAVQTASMVSSGLRPIVLMERSTNDDNKCSFEEKIKAVQQAGASGAIIFDSMNEGPITMVFENENEILIPSAFISHEAGMTLMELLQDNTQPITLLQPEPELDWRIALSMFEVVSFSSGYMIFFILWFPVAVWRSFNLIKKQKIHNAVFKIVTEDDEFKSNIENKIDSKFLPLNSFEHPMNHYCNILSNFLLLTIIIFIWETLLFEYYIDKKNNHSKNPTFDASREDAIQFGVHIMMDSLYIAFCLLLLNYIIKQIFQLCCGTSSSSSTQDDIENAIIEINHDNKCNNEKDSPLLTQSNVMEISMTDPSAPEYSQLTTYEPPSPASFVVNTGKSYKYFIESKPCKVHKI